MPSSLRRNKKGVKEALYTSKYETVHGKPLDRFPLSGMTLDQIIKKSLGSREVNRHLKRIYGNAEHANLLLVLKYRTDPKNSNTTRYIDVGKGDLPTLIKLTEKLIEDTYTRYLTSKDQDETEILEAENLFHIVNATLWMFPENLGSGRKFDKFILLTNDKNKENLYQAHASSTNQLCFLDCYARYMDLPLETVKKQYSRSCFENPIEFVRSKCLTHIVTDKKYIAGVMNYYREGNHTAFVTKCTANQTLQYETKYFKPTPVKFKNMSLLMAIDFEFNMDLRENTRTASAPRIAALSYISPETNKIVIDSYEGDQCLSRIISKLCILSQSYQDLTKYCYSANGRGVEHQYLMQEIAKTTASNFYITNVEGTKIKSFSYAGIYFVDSQLLFPGSLDNFCKSMGVIGKTPIEEIMIQKGFWTKEQGNFMVDNKWATGCDEKTDIEVDYCEQDCVCLLQALMEYNKLLIEVHNLFGTKKLGSESWLLCKPSLSGVASWILQNQYDIQMTPNALVPLVQESYYGGRTECFYLGEVPGEVCVTDINSSYPHTMREGICVNPVLHTKPGLQFLKNLLKDKKHFLAFGSITHKSDLGKFAVRKQDKIIFPVGTFQTHFWDHELYNIENTLDPEITIHDVKYLITFDLDTCISDPLEKVYQKRLDVGKNTPLGTCMKLFMNNLYGRFGMKQERQIMGLIVDYSEFGNKYKTDLLFKEYVNEFKSVEIEGRDICNCICSCGASDDDVSNPYDLDCTCRCNCKTQELEVWKTKVNKSVEVNNLFASRTTSLSRFNLWKKLVSLKDTNKLLYCDTDSVYYKPSPEHVKPPNETFLGGWDLEVIYDMVIKTLKVYGYNKEKKDTPELVRDVMHYKGVAQPVSLSEIQTSETWLRKDFTIYVCNLIKVSSFEYTKGIVQANGTIHPFLL